MNPERNLLLNIKAILCVHKKQKRIKLIFQSDQELNIRVRQIPGSLWSSGMRSWHIPDTTENRKLFDLKPEFLLNDSFINSLTRFSDWLKSKRYSESTVKTYMESLRVFFAFLQKDSVSEINEDDIIRFNNLYILKKRLSGSYQNQVVNAIKLFFRVITDTGFKVELIHRPKREKVLPNVLSKEEVKQLLEAHRNMKHRVMLSMIYACGLRCGELLQLKPEHIDSKRMVLWIKQAKGKKDRIVPLSLKILRLLREYYIAYKPKIYLFEGIHPGSNYDPRSLQQVMKLAAKKAGISKPVTLHWLRHSYATHLLENGTDLRYIQEILGHTSSRTTEIYTHVSTRNIQNIKSPFDLL